MGRFVLPRRLSLQKLSRSTTFYAFIGFFCFYLYTRVDTLTSNGVSNHLVEYTPAPYDVFSFGMLCSLFAIAISVRARAVCCEFAPLAVAATLLAISPLYSVVGMPHAVALALAFLGGAGKGIVVLHLGRMLSMLDISCVELCRHPEVRRSFPSVTTCDISCGRLVERSFMRNRRFSRV